MVHGVVGCVLGYVFGANTSTYVFSPSSH